MATSFRKKLEKAQSTCLPFESILSESLLCVCVALSDAIGCPIEFIFFPLLTIIAGCMGVNAHIAINTMWREPAILWFIIAANKGQKKTAALRILKKPLQEIEEMESNKWYAEHGNVQNDSPPQLSIDNFSFEELHHVMRRNGSQMLGLFDEMSTMYSQLDLYKQSGSVMDRKTLITLNGGSSWSRNYRNYTASMSQTAFNMSGFIQPTFVEKMLLSDDADGFNDRQMFVFPPQRDVLFNDLKLPIPVNVPSLRSVYSHVREMHTTSHDYILDDDALIEFEKYHDNLVRRQSLQHNENVQGILSKARGYVARLSMVLYVLEKSLEKILEGENPECPSTTWSVTITADCVSAAASIMDYLINQKLIMMDIVEIGPSDQPAVDNTDVPNSDKVRRLLTMISEDDDGHISPSKVAQKHICAPICGKYSVTSAMKLFDTVETLGFGKTVEQTTATNRRVKKFRKTPYDLLSSEARTTLRQIRITEESYRSSFIPTGSASSLLDTSSSTSSLNSSSLE